MERNLTLCQARGMERLFNNLNEWKAGRPMMDAGDGSSSSNGHESWKPSSAAGASTGDQSAVGLTSDGDAQKRLSEQESGGSIRVDDEKCQVVTREIKRGGWMAVQCFALLLC
jgi:hypothetical protein